MYLTTCVYMQRGWDEGCKLFLTMHCDLASPMAAPVLQNDQIVKNFQYITHNFFTNNEIHKYTKI